MITSRRAFIGGAMALAALSSAHAQTSLIVDPSGGGDFATLADLEAFLNSHYSNASVRVLRGDYTPDHMSLVFYQKQLVLDFEPGCAIRWNQAVSKNGLHMGLNGHLMARGNGCLIEGFNEGTGNGISGYGATVDVSDFKIRGCRDGFSLHHVNDRGIARRLDIRGATKYAVAHVGGSNSLHEDCHFEPADGANGIAHLLDGQHDFVRSAFLPSPDGLSDRVQASPGVTFLNCMLGTASQPVTIEGNPIIIGGTVNGEAV